MIVCHCLLFKSNRIIIIRVFLMNDDPHTRLRILQNRLHTFLIDGDTTAGEYLVFSFTFLLTSLRYI